MPSFSPRLTSSTRSKHTQSLSQGQLSVRRLGKWVSSMTVLTGCVRNVRSPADVPMTSSGRRRPIFPSLDAGLPRHLIAN